MNTTVRALVIALGFFRVLPAQIYITFGILGTALIPVLAGPLWAAPATLANMSLVVYGGWRGLRRYRALHGFMKWTP